MHEDDIYYELKQIRTLVKTLSWLLDTQDQHTRVDDAVDIQLMKIVELHHNMVTKVGCDADS